MAKNSYCIRIGVNNPISNILFCNETGDADKSILPGPRTDQSITANGTLFLKQKLMLDFDNPHPDDLEWLYEKIPAIDLRDAAVNPANCDENLAYAFLLSNLNKALSKETGTTTVSSKDLKLSSERPIVAYCSYVAPGTEFFGVRFESPKILTSPISTRVGDIDSESANNV